MTSAYSDQNSTSSSSHGKIHQKVDVQKSSFPVHLFFLPTVWSITLTHSFKSYIFPVSQSHFGKPKLTLTETDIDLCQMHLDQIKYFVNLTSLLMSVLMTKNYYWRKKTSLQSERILAKLSLQWWFQSHLMNV